MSQYDSLGDARIAACLREDLDKVDSLANELRMRGWTVKFDTLDVSTIINKQYVTSCKITKTHVEELS